MLPKNSSCVEYNEGKHAKCVAKEERLRREKERAERLAVQDAVVSRRLANEEAEREAQRQAEVAERKRRYGRHDYPSYYTRAGLNEKEPELPKNVDRRRRTAEKRRLRREKKEKAERLAARDAVYASRAVREKEPEPELPQKINRTIRQSAYIKMVSAPNSNLCRPIESPELDLLIHDDIGNKGFGKIKAAEKVIRWSSSYV